MLNLAAIFLSLDILLCTIGIFASVTVFLAGLGCILAGIVSIAIDKESVSNERWERLIARYHKNPKRLDGIR